MTKIDANEELARIIVESRDRFGAAKDAPTGRGLYGYLNEGLAREEGGHEGEFAQFIRHLLSRLSIWWDDDAYRLLPILVPWCVRDRTCRWDSGVEAWGSPRADGHFRDDNSIIKKLPMPLVVRGTLDHPYTGRRPYRGFTACHIWGRLSQGQLAGEQASLYSFVPNLVWLPSALAPLSDRHGSMVQHLLQRTSVAMFGRLRPASPLEAYAQRSWAILPLPPERGPVLDPDRLARFATEARFRRRRLATISRFIDSAEAVMLGTQPTKKVVSSRYAPGLTALDRKSIASFRESLVAYREAVLAAESTESSARLAPGLDRSHD